MASGEVAIGPTGAPVFAYRRKAHGLQAGDWLPEYGARVTGAPARDPEDGAVWVSLDSGEDVRFTPRGKALVYREYRARGLVADARADWYEARQAWEQAREEVALGYRTEEAEYQARNPAPTLQAFLAEHGAAAREVEWTREGRRTLAAAMRAAGVPVTPESWAAAKAMGTPSPTPEALQAVCKVA